MSRKPYQPHGHLLDSPVMAAMRDVAYGSTTVRDTRRVMDKAERMRDDEALLQAAEEKRQRKMLKRRA